MDTPFVPYSVVGAGSVAGVAADKKKRVSVCSVGVELGDSPPLTSAPMSQDSGERHQALPVMNREVPLSLNI